MIPGSERILLDLEKLFLLLDSVEHIKTTLAVLDKIQAVGIPKILVFNKTDQLDLLEQAILRRNYPEAVFISAVQGNVMELRQEIANFFERRMQRHVFL